MLLLQLVPVDLPFLWEAVADTVFLAGVCGPALWWISIRPLARQIDEASQRAETARVELASELSGQEVDARVFRALEMADDEQGACNVVERTVSSEFTHHDGELLMADSSQAHLHRVLSISEEPPGCPATSPHDCVAVRDGQARLFESSEAIDACPRLQSRGREPLSAVCVPMSILGRSVGVLHLTGPADSLPEEVVPRLSRLISATGARLGLLRALSDSELQAGTDALTGLANRRTLENRMNRMKRAGTSFAVLMADLDHFKMLNDTHGHEVGDRALRLFARVLDEVVRSEDLAARYGGEEFVCLIEGGDTDIGLLAGERIRRILSEFLADSSVPPFTVSIGVASTTDGSDSAEVLHQADQAMCVAKRNGRSRVETA